MISGGVCSKDIMGRTKDQRERRHENGEEAY